MADRVRRQFGDTAGVVITDQAMYDWINDAMREIVLDQKLLRLKATSSTLIGQSNYGFPTDLLRLDHVSVDGEALEQTTTQQISRTVENMDDSVNFPRGTPEYYWVYGREIYLYPAPAAVKTITMYYYRNPTEVTALANTPELPAEYDNRIIEYCLAQAAELDDDDNRAQLKRQQFEIGLDKTKDEQEGGQDMYAHMGVSLADSYGYSYRDEW
jgi:hypothetical protein